MLDEPTANLDPITEREMLDTTYELMRNRAALVVTHRLVRMEEMDEILVLDAGRIVERGTHVELVRAGPYYQMLKVQRGAANPLRLSSGVLALLRDVAHDPGDQYLIVGRKLVAFGLPSGSAPSRSISSSPFASSSSAMSSWERPSSMRSSTRSSQSSGVAPAHPGAAPRPRKNRSGWDTVFAARSCGWYRYSPFQALMFPTSGGGVGGFTYDWPG